MNAAAHGTRTNFINTRRGDGNQTQGEHAARFYLYDVRTQSKPRCDDKSQWGGGRPGQGAGAPSLPLPSLGCLPSLSPSLACLRLATPVLRGDPLLIKITAKPSGFSRELVSLGEDFLNQTSEWNFFLSK